MTATGRSGGYHIDLEELFLVLESPGHHVLDMPDNITFSPQGNLLVCEDRPDANHRRGITRDGAVFDLALNAIPGHEHEEWAGATFSPGGNTLFVNVQDPGMTFAIWGPWRRGPL